MGGLLVLGAAAGTALLARSAVKRSKPRDPPSIPSREDQEVQDARRRAIRNTGRGRGATLLTGPLGVPGPTNVRRKSLLGE